LLENDLDSVLIYSINCHGRDELVLPAAQILSLLYSEFEVSEVSWIEGLGSRQCLLGTMLISLL